MADFDLPLTAIPEARAGMIAGGEAKEDAYLTSVAVKAGVFVTDVGATYKKIKNIAAITDALCGVTRYLAGKEPSGDGVNEYAIGDMATVRRKGQIWVISENAFVVGGAVHVRAIANGGNNLIGAIRNAADGVNTIAAAGMRVVKPSVTVESVILTLLELNIPA